MDTAKAMAILAAVSVLILAGCGGGQGDSTDAGISKAEFASRARAICIRASAERQERFKEAVEHTAGHGQKATQRERHQVFYEVFVPPYRKQIDSLKKIPLAEGKEGEAVALIAAMERALSRVEANPLGLAHSTEQLAGAERLAARYGLEQCVI
jgi:hypothetical protein